MINIFEYIQKDKDLLGKIVIVKNNKIFRVVNTYKEAFKIAKNRQEFQIFKIPNNIYETRILPLRIKSFKKHPWLPLYPIKFFIDDNFVIENALIDSGADISAINYSFGVEIGLKKEKHDYIFQVEGIGGTMDYILKSIQIEIDNYLLQIPVAWLQDKDSADIIIGREVVFDLFDIEFKQKDERIIFAKRDDNMIY